MAYWLSCIVLRKTRDFITMSQSGSKGLTDSMMADKTLLFRARVGNGTRFMVPLGIAVNSVR